MTCAPGPEGQVSPCQVLVVDDDKDIREALQEILVQEGFAVASAKHGLEAIEYLRSSPPPRVILLDLSMPVMDGVTFRREQRRDPELAKIPVIAFSAAAGLTEAVRGLDMAGTLRKPLRIDSLLDTLSKFC